MINHVALLAISVAYVGVLFGLAYAGDVRARNAPRASRHALVYCLALSIYCTSWTFYGAVGRATSSGWDFLPIYLGPVCLFLFGYPVLQRIVQISKGNNITSVADFIGARYGRHQIVPSIVAVIATIGIVPYIALQLKAVSFGFDVMVGGGVASAEGSGTTALVAAVMAAFAILFGTRELSATENHHGMVLAVAFESLVKLIAFIAVGLYATFLLYGPGLEQITWSRSLSLGTSGGSSTSNFLTQTLLAAFAIVCLPRQFHIGVVENASPRDLKAARVVFPIYLLLVSLFVLPIAEAGRAHFAARQVAPDTFVLALPLALGHPWLGLAAYIGGFSAATGMVIVEAIALATMISNELVMPVLVRSRGFGRIGGLSIPRVLQLVRRIAVVLIISLAYLYYTSFTGTGTLTEIGLLSFAAVAQFAPSLFGGVLWKGGSYVGAAAGLASGALLWFYTLLLPAMAKTGSWSGSLLAHGPFGIAWLRPQALLGSEIADPLTHGVAWSLFVNASCYVGLSLLRKPGLRDSLQSANFLDIRRTPTVPTVELPHSLATVGDLHELAHRFLGGSRASELLQSCSPAQGGTLDSNDQVSPRFARLVEHALAGVIGASSARLVLSTTLRGRNMRPEDVVRLLDETSHAILFTRELLRTALENLPQGISVIDDQLRLVAWNQRYQSLFGYPSELLVIGRPIEDLIRFNAGRGWLVTDDIEKSVERRLMFMRAGGAYLHEREMPNGVVLEMRGNPMPGGGFVTSYSDVTNYKQAQAALQEGNTSLEMRVSERTAELVRLNTELARSKVEIERAHLSKTRFLAAAAHDLAQPITAARLFISSVDRRQLAGPSIGLVEKAQAALGSAEQTLTGLLDYSRLDGGSERVRREHFELEAVVQSLLDDFALLAIEKGLTLKAHGCRQVVLSDPYLLRRVLQNFLSNAIRYTARGRVVVGCRRHGDSVTIHVIDTGPGIPARLHADVFQEYRQFVGRDRVARVGLGLGLAIARRISVLLDHPIGLRSTVGRGSDFSIRCPIGDRSQVESRRALPAASPAGPFAGKTVYCVEDQQEVLAGLEALLASWGCRTQGYRDAALALDGASGSWLPPDLLIVDYHLDSDAQGLDVAHRLRAIWRRNVPVIVVTAADLREHQLRPDEGLVHILRKPLRPGALRALMDVVLS